MEPLDGRRDPQYPFRNGSVFVACEKPIPASDLINSMLRGRKLQVIDRPVRCHNPDMFAYQLRPLFDHEPADYSPPCAQAYCSSTLLYGGDYVLLLDLCIQNSREVERQTSRERQNRPPESVGDLPYSCHAQGTNYVTGRLRAASFQKFQTLIRDVFNSPITSDDRFMAKEITITNARTKNSSL